MIRFLIDAQLPPELARRLTARGYVAEHVNRIGLGDIGDSHLATCGSHRCDFGHQG
jgi:predicted nuclease of predicted toxin-antitoxin system